MSKKEKSRSTTPVEPDLVPHAVADTSVDADGDEVMNVVPPRALLKPDPPPFPNQWQPSSTSPVIVYWELLGDTYHVRLDLLLTSETWVDGRPVPVVTPQTIVETSLHQRRPSVPFNVRTETSAFEQLLLSGSFRWTQDILGPHLWIYNLRYPGGGVDSHNLQ